MFTANSLKMSTSLWDWQLASADGLPLTNDDCYLLLDAEFSDDLLKTFPGAAPKLEASVGEYQVQEDGSLYPPSPSSPSSPPETKPSRAQLASDLLQQLDHQCKQENLFSNWLEEKVELPVFEGIPEAAAYPAHLAHPVHPAHPAPQPTEELLREFETVYGNVELTHLTPPQSPPGPATQLLLSYAQAQCAAPVLLPPPPPPPQPQCNPDAWFELQSVEELLSAPVSASASTSPRSSPPSSPRSSADEDWGRPKPYSRATDDRRSRKKEQNKNAATRYRQKKKAEVEVLLGEEHALRQRHSDLGAQRADLQREIRYLKGLMRELFKAKGLIK